MRDRCRLLATVLTVTLLGVACAQPATKQPEVATPDPAAVKADIEAANARFLDAFKKGDKAPIMANYAADAILMMPGAPMSQGTAAIDKVFSDFLAQFALKESNLRTIDVAVGGDLAVETGTFEWTLTPKKGADLKDKGKYLTAWKRQADGSWKIIRDINNTDRPAK